MYLVYPFSKNGPQIQLLMISPKTFQWKKLVVYVSRWGSIQYRVGFVLFLFSVMVSVFAPKLHVPWYLRNLGSLFIWTSLPLSLIARSRVLLVTLSKNM